MFHFEDSGFDYVGIGCVVGMAALCVEHDNLYIVIVLVSCKEQYTCTRII